MADENVSIRGVYNLTNPRRAQMWADAGANTGPAPVAPTVTIQPTILPTGKGVGDSVTLGLGAASGTPAPTATWTFTRDGADYSSHVDPQLAVEFTEAGVYVLTVTWTNSAGSVVSNAISYTVAAATTPTGDLATAARTHIEGVPTYAGTTTAVTSVTATGTAARTFNPVGNGAEVAVDSRGLLFASGKYLRSTGTDVAPTGGFIAAIKVDVDTVTATDVLLTLSGGMTVNLRWDGANGRPLYNVNVTGTAVNYNGVTGARTAMVMAIEADYEAGTIRYWNGAALVTVTGVTFANKSWTTVDLGNALTGAVLRADIITRDTGQAWPATLEQVLGIYGGAVAVPLP